jgi:hypothetical protein
MAKVTIDSSGRFVSRRQDDKTKSQPETVTMEERALSSGDVALSGVQDDQQGKAGNVPEVRGEP